MLLGKRIKSLRKEKGLTQEELGKIINVTKVSICCYERESRVPTLETLIALAEVFGVDVDYLLGNDLVFLWYTILYSKVGVLWRLESILIVIYLL